MSAVFAPTREVWFVLRIALARAICRAHELKSDHLADAGRILGRLSTTPHTAKATARAVLDVTKHALRLLRCCSAAGSGGAAPVGTRDHFQLVAVGVGKVNPAPAIDVVDLAGAMSRRVGPEATASYSRKRRKSSIRCRSGILSLG
jgi:hypothetical protein